jgi:hypothetical protein
MPVRYFRVCGRSAVETCNVGQRWRPSGTMAGPDALSIILGIAVRLSDVIILEAGRQDLHSSLFAGRYFFEVRIA